MQIGFIGVGKLGLPVAVAMDYKGHKVMGYDINPKVKKGIKAIDLLTTFEANETGKGSIKPMIQASMVKFSDQLDEVIKFGDIIFIAVQTPHDDKYEGITRIPDERKDFDYSYLIESIKQISKVVDESNQNKIVVIISTVLPGTIRKYVIPVMSSKIQLCYNPYFIAMGTTVRDFLFPEFILLGVTNQVAREKVVEFYKSITKSPVYETSLENAELIKVAYNTFISTKLVFVNTIMEMCDKLPGTNIDEVTNALKMGNRRLISQMYMSGGMGDGGGCHPRDNIALSWLSKELNISYNLFDSIMIGREQQTETLAEIIIKKYHAYDKNLPICILGKAFKANTNLITGSPAILLKNILIEKGYKVSMYDPYIDSDNFKLTKQLYFIGTKHDVFLTYDFPEGSCIIDPHRYIKEKNGVELYQIGIGDKKTFK